ncbi:MAG: hypothetical protein IH873_04050 [Chloroflexi bacterium]|nr:hypothetical protein [Chloroflexota bacterium]
MYRHFGGRLRRVWNFIYPRGNLDSRACGNGKPHGHIVTGCYGSAHVSANQHRRADRGGHYRAHRDAIPEPYPNSYRYAGKNPHTHAHTRTCADADTRTHTRAHWSAHDR